MPTKVRKISPAKRISSTQKKNGNKVYPLLKEFRPNLKVFLFSVYSLDGPAQEIMDASAHGFLQKPVTIEDLSEKLTELLQAK